MFSFSSSVNYLPIFPMGYFLNFRLRNIFLNIIIFDEIKNIFVFDLYVYAIVPNGTLWSIVTIFSLLKIVFWPTVCSMLVNILCALENNVYSATVCMDCSKIFNQGQFFENIIVIFSLITHFCLSDRSSYLSDKNLLEPPGKEWQAGTDPPLSAEALRDHKLLCSPAFVL